MKKRFLSLFMATVMTVSSIPQNVFTVHAHEAEVQEIAAEGAGSEEELEVFEEIDAFETEVPSDDAILLPEQDDSGEMLEILPEDLEMVTDSADSEAEETDISENMEAGIPDDAELEITGLEIIEEELVPIEVQKDALTLGSDGMENGEAADLVDSGCTGAAGEDGTGGDSEDTEEDGSNEDGEEEDDSEVTVTEIPKKVSGELTLGASLKAEITEPGQRLWYEVSIETEGTYWFTGGTIDPENNLDSVATLYDVNGKELAYNDDGVDDANHFGILYTLSKGTYYLCVEAYDLEETGSLSVNMPVAPIGITQLINYSEEFLYGRYPNLDIVKAVIEYTDGNEKILGRYEVDEDENGLDFYLVGEEDYYLDEEVPIGEYTLRVRYKNIYADFPYNVVAFADYTGNGVLSTASSVTVPAASVIRNKSYDYWFEAEEAGKWKISTNGADWLECINEEDIIDSDQEANGTEAVVSVYLEKGERVLVSAGVDRKNVSDIIFSVEKGKMVSGIRLDVPKQVACYDVYADAKVTLSYEDSSIPDQPLSFNGKNQVRDSYGNQVVLQLENYSGDLGTYTYRASCGTVSDSSEVEVISRLAAYGDSYEKWENITEKPLTFTFDAGEQDEFLYEYCVVTPTVSEDYTINWECSGYAQVSIYTDREELLIYDMNDGSGQFCVSLTAGEDYLFELFGMEETQMTVSAKLAADITGMRILEAPAKMHDWYEYLTGLKIELTYATAEGETEDVREYNASQKTEDGRYFSVSLQDENGEEPDECEYGTVYNIIVTCGSFTASTTVEYVEAKEFSLPVGTGITALEEQEQYYWYIRYTAETAGYYRFTSEGVEILLEDADDRWHYLPQTIYLAEGETAYMEVEEGEAEDPSAMSVTVERLPDIETIRISNYDNLKAGEWTEQLQVTYSYVQGEEGTEEIPDYTGGLFEESSDYGYKNSITLTNLETGEEFIPEDEYDLEYAYNEAPAGIYALVITAGGKTSEPFTIQLKGWWDLLPELKLDEGTVTFTSEQASAHYQVSPEETGGYCFEVEGAYGHFYLSDGDRTVGDSIGSFNGKDALVLEKGRKYVVWLGQHDNENGEYAETFTVKVSKVPAVDLDSVEISGIDGDYWSGIEYIDPKSDILLSYNYTDGTSASIYGSGQEAYGYRIGEYGLKDSDGERISGDEVLAEDTYDFTFKFAGRIYETEVNVKTPSLDALTELSNGKTYTLSHGQKLTGWFKAETANVYDMIVRGCEVRITNTDTLGSAWNYWDDCNTWFDEGTYYISVKNTGNETAQFSLTRPLGIENLTVTPGFTSFPAGFAFNPLAGMKITAKEEIAGADTESGGSEGTEEEVIGGSTGAAENTRSAEEVVGGSTGTADRKIIELFERNEYIYDEEWNYVSYEMRNTEDNSVADPEQGLVAGTYNVTVNYRGATASYPFTVNAVANHFTENTGEFENGVQIPTTGIQYYKFRAESVRYYLYFTESMNAWVYDSDGNRVVKEYGNPMYWNGLVSGENYYVVLWRSPAVSVSSDNAQMELEARLGAVNVTAEFDKQVEFGDLGYFRNLKFTVSYSDGSVKEIYPWREQNWQDGQGYPIGHDLLDSKGNYCYGYLEPGTYTAKVYFGTWSWEYEFIITKRDVTEFSNEASPLTIPANSNVVYQFPDTEANHTKLTFSDNSGNYRYGYGYEGGSWISLIESEENSCFINGDEWQGIRYLTIWNEASEPLTLHVNMAAIQGRSVSVKSDIVPESEPLGWRNIADQINKTEVSVQKDGESQTETRELWGSADADGYRYDYQLYFNGNEIDWYELDGLLTEGTLLIEYYQIWNGTWETEPFASDEVTFVASDSEKLTVSGASAVVEDISLPAGTLKEFSFTAPVKDNYRFSFSDTVTLYYRQNNEKWSGTGNAWTIDLEEGETLEFAVCAEEAATIELMQIRPMEYQLNLSVAEEAMVYTGEALEPSVTVTYGAEGLPVSEEDYTVLYENNTEAGTAYVSIIGQNGYEGLYAYATFEITRRPMDSEDITVEMSWESSPYNSEEQSPEITVKHGDVILTEGTDYEISVLASDLIHAGTKEICVNGSGNYSGSREEAFSITALDLEALGDEITVDPIEDQKYQSGGCTPYPLVYRNGTQLQYLKDYSVEYVNNTVPGTAYVVINGRGDYSGSIYRTFTIFASDLSEAEVYNGTIYSVTGMDIMPKLEIWMDNCLLSEGTDYTVAYENCLDPGTATATVTGINGYYGSLTFSYQIVEMPIRMSNLTWTDLTEGENQTPENGHMTVWYRWMPSQSAIFRIAKSADSGDEVRIYRADTESEFLTRLQDELIEVTENGQNGLFTADKDTVYFIQLTKQADAVRIEMPVSLQEEVTSIQTPLLETAVWKLVPEEDGTYQFISDAEGVLQVYSEELTELTTIELIQTETEDSEGATETVYAGMGNFAAGVPYILVWSGGSADRTLTVNRAEDRYMSLLEGVNSVYIPQGGSQTFVLPTGEGRKYISQDTAVLSYTYTDADNAQRTGSGYSFGYEAAEEETWITVNNISSQAVTKLELGSVPEWTAKANFALVPEKIISGWADTAASLICIEATQEGSTVSELLTEKKDVYGYSWKVQYEQNDAVLEALQLEEGIFSVKVIESWAGSESPIGSFELEIVGEEALPELRRGNGMWEEKLKTSSMYFYTPMIDGSYQLSFPDMMYASMQRDTEAVLCNTAEAQTQAGETGYVLIAPASVEQYDCSYNLKRKDAVAAFDGSAGSVIFNGMEQSPVLTLTDSISGLTLRKDVDYSVSDASGFVNAGTHAVYVYGEGEYNGAGCYVDFTVQPLDIGTLTFEEETYAYTGEPISFAGGSMIGEYTVTDADYTITQAPEDSISIGSKTSVLSGTGNFTGSKEVAYQIVPCSVEGADIQVTGDCTFTGGEVKPAIRVLVNGRELTLDTDFTVVYEQNQFAGIASLTITGTGNYTGTCSRQFTILAKDLSQEEVVFDPIDPQVYDQNAKEPELHAVYGEDELEAGTDYTVSYSNNIKIGTASVTVYGKGNYTGSRTLTFTIENEKMPADAAPQPLEFEQKHEVLQEEAWYQFTAEADEVIKITASGAAPTALKLYQKQAGQSAAERIWHGADTASDDTAVWILGVDAGSTTVLSVQAGLAVCAERAAVLAVGERADTADAETFAVYRLETAESENYRLFAQNTDVRLAVSTSDGLVWYEANFGMNGSYLETAQEDAKAAEVYPYCQNLELMEGEDLFLVAKNGSGIYQVEKMPYITAVTVVRETLKSVYNRFDTEFLRGMQLEISYEDGTAQTLTAGERDSWGRSLEYEIFDENERYCQNGQVLSPGQYGRRISAHGEDIRLAPAAEEVSMENGFTVLALADSYPENSMYPGMEMGCFGLDENGELNLYPFTADKDWNYIFESDEPICITYYTEAGEGLTAGNRTSSELELKAGTYYLKIASAADEKAEVTVTPKLRTAPAAVPELNALETTNSVTLSWQMSPEIDTGYAIYRKNEVTGEFEEVQTISDRTITRWADTDVVTGTEYTYCIRVTYGLYVKSEPSPEVTRGPGVDYEAPLVTNVSPQTGSRLNGIANISVQAQDNVAVTRTWLEIQKEDQSWETLCESTGAYCSGELDTTQYEGIIRVRGMAADERGNESSGLTVQYEVDNAGPEQVKDVAVKSATSVTITLEWSDVADEDLGWFAVERRLSDGSWQQIGTTSTTLGMNMTGLQPDHTYLYRVVAYDQLGNRGTASDSVEASTLSDTTAPVNSYLAPQPGYYQNRIPVTVGGSDDYGIASMTLQLCPADGSWMDVYTWNYTTAEKRRTESYSLDVSQVTEGRVRVRAIVTDTAGNCSDTSNLAPYVEYMIDRTAPAAPTFTSAIGRNGYIELTWEQGAENDLSGYTVYRSDAENGSFAVLAENLKSLNYFDRTAKAGTEWFYRITVKDQAGNTSGLSEVKSAEVAADTQKPMIRSIYPADGEVMGSGYHMISVLVTDNTELAKVSVSYCVNDSEEYQELSSSVVSGVQANPDFTLPIEKLEDGDTITVQVSAEDAAGNISTTISQTYELDLASASVSDAQAEFLEEENAVALSWIGGAEADVQGYRIYRRISGRDSWQLIIQTAAESGKTAYTATDWNPQQEEVEYIYRIESLDLVGNTASADTNTVDLPDRSHPKAVLDCESVMEMAVQYRISALNSTDNTEIASYQIDMGDGTVYRTAEAVHSYAKAGEYTIKLTVTDVDGNEDVLYKDIIVKEREQLGFVRVLVQGTNGQPIPNAPVYFDLGSPNQFIRTTGANGIAEFTAEKGMHTVGCVIGNNEYLPQKKDVAVTSNTTSDLTFTMVKQPIIEGKFEIKRMTLEEIKAAGIDIDNPANQYIVDMTVHLEYGTTSYDLGMTYNGFTGETIAKPVLIPGGGGSGGRMLIPGIIGGTRGGSGGSTGGSGGTGGSENERIPEQELAVAILDVPVGTSILKEFFDVKLHIINNASSEFSMLNNIVTLNVPTGLTVVPTEGTEDSASVVIPEIVGGTQKTVNWILRGDEIGKYHLSADYSGVLSEFEVPMSARFEAEEPIEVFGMSGMKLTMYVAEELKKQTLYFDLELENQGEIEVYMPDLFSDDAEMVYEEYYIGEELAAGYDASVMRPGDRLVRHYQQDASELSDGYTKLQRYWMDAAQTYGLTIEIIRKPLDYFRAADDIVTLRFDSQGGTPVADIEGLTKGKTFAKLKGTSGFENLKWPIPAKDGMYFNGWYTTADASGELFTQDSELTASRILYASWGKYSTENGALAEKTGKGEYGIHVVNTAGKPLAGAGVTFNGVNGVTDKDGDVVFKKPSKNVVKLAVSCEGYVDYSESEYALQEKRYDLVTLYTEKENKYLLKKAVYNELLPGSANVLKKKKRLIALYDESGLLRDFSFYINCYLSSSDDSDFLRLELWQNNKLIATADKLSSDGCVKLENLKIESFASGGGVYVKTIFQSGGEEKSVKNNLNLEFVADPADIEFSIGESITLKVDSGVPLLGGMEFKLKSPVDLPTIKVKSDGTVIVGINIADNELEKDTTKEFMDSLTSARQAGGMRLGSEEMAKKINALRKDNGSQGKEFKWNVIGYLEGQLTNDGGLAQLTGKIVGTAGLSNEWNWQLPITVVPVTAQVEVGVEGEVAGSVGYDFEEDDWSFALDSSVTGEVEGFIGAGLSGIAAAGGYAGGSMKLSMSHLLLPQSLEATLGGGLKVYFGPFEYKWSLIEKTFYIWTRTRALAGETIFVNPKELYSLEVYEYTDRTYLDEQSDWNGENTSEASGTISELLTETYGASQPQIVSAGGQTIMVYIGDTKESNRSSANMGQLMYSVYENGIWSKPASVDQNDRADISFNLYTANDRIYLVYQEAEQVFTDEINRNPEEYFKALGVVTAEFDPEQSCFTNMQKTSEGQETRYNSQPSTAVNGNRQMTVWVSNESGNCFGLNQTNEIHMRISENGTQGEIRVLADGRNSIVSLQAGVLDDSFAIAYIMDQDNSLDTLDDRTLYLLKEDGTQYEIATARISGSQFTAVPGQEKPALVWYQDGSIMIQSGFGTAPRVLIDGSVYRVNEAFRIVGDYILYIGADENGSSNVYAMIYKDGAFKEPVFVTNQTQSIYEISAAQIDGEIGLVMMQNQQTGSEGAEVDHYTMSYMTLAETHNPVLTSAEFSYQSVVPNEAFDIAFYVKNSGTADITSVTAEVTDAEGTVLAQEIYEQTIASGEKGEFILAMTAPAELDETEYTFRIYETGSEPQQKNAMTFQLNETDLSLAAEVTRIGSVYEITAEVTNQGYLTSGGTLTVSGSKNDSIFSEMTIGPLEPSESAVYVVRLDASQFTVAEDVLMLTLVSEEKDYSSFNNTCIEMIYLVHEISFYVEGSVYARDYVEDGNQLVLPNDPEGATEFIGWYDVYSGEKLTEEAVVNTSAEYEARFADALYRIAKADGSILATDKKEVMLHALAGAEAVTVTILTDTEVTDTLIIAEENTLVIPAGYSLEILEGGCLNNAGTLQTDGSLNNAGTLTNTEILLINGTLRNTGSLFNTGTINNNGSVEHTGNAVNDGNIYNNNSMICEQGTITGSGQLVNSGTLSGEEQISCSISNHVHVWASVAVVDVEASCYQTGSRSRHCTVDGCQAKTGIAQIPMTDHTYGDWMVLKEATLTAEGTRTHTCTVCSHVETEEIPNLTDAPQEMAGITAEGYTGVYDGASHSITLTGIPKQATVKYFMTENGTALSENPGFVQEGLYTVWYLITREGYVDLKGSAVVEITGCAHSFLEEWETDVEATTESAGSKSRHCSVIGCEAVTDVTVIPKLKSSYSQMQDDLSEITEENAREEANQDILSEHVETVLDEESAYAVAENVDMNTVVQLEELYLESVKESSDSGETTKAPVADTHTELVNAAGAEQVNVVQAEGAAITAAAAVKDEDAATENITVQAKLQVKALSYDEIEPDEEIQEIQVIKEMMTDGMALAYDINLSVVDAKTKAAVAGYENIQPKAPIRITLPIPLELRYAEKLLLLHRKDSGEIETLEYTRDHEANTITFVAKEFSEHYLIPEDAVHEHDFSKLIAEKEMKCGSDGWRKYRCLYCHKMKTEIIPAAAEHAGGEATCEDAAICTLCGEVYGEPLGHTGGEATCQQKAVCDTCREAYGELEPCSGGTATCISPAICTMCQQPYGTSTGKHIYSNEWAVDTPAGCLSVGSKSHHCVSDPECTEKADITEISALGHTGGEADCKKQAVCERCGNGYGELKEHGGGEATCTEQAICSGCGEPYGELKDHTGGTATCQSPAICTVCWKPYGEKGDHSFSDSFTTDVKPTCIDEGSQSRHCTIEGCTEKADEKPVGKTDHTGGTETCTAGKICTVCSIEYSDALDHTGGSATCTDQAICTRCSQAYGELKAHSGGTATCQSPSICDSCKKPYGAKGGHSYSNSYTVDEKPTCIDEGSQSRHCTIEGCTEKTDAKPVGKTDHTGGIATCTVGKICTVCNVEYSDALGHTGGSATCTNQPICARCNQAYGELKAHRGGTVTCQSPAICTGCGKPYGNKGGHSYETVWTIDVQPTCTTTGSRSHHCTVSGCTSTTGNETIKALGHTGGETTCTKQAVCTRCGTGYGSLKSHTGGTATCTSGAECEVCGQTYGNPDTTNHSYGDYVRTKEPTAVEEGIEIRTCTRCGAQDPEARSIEKLEPYIVMSATSIPLQRKKSTTKVKVLEMQTGDSVVSWKSNKTSVAKVSKSGKITAGSKTGTATITVTLASGLKQKIKVTVQKTKVITKKITGLKKKVTLKKGKKLTLTPVITPITTSDKLTFISSNKKIASVTSKGVIKGVKKGKAKITVKSGKKTYTVTITVK